LTVIQINTKFAETPMTEIERFFVQLQPHQVQVTTLSTFFKEMS